MKYFQFILFLAFWANISAQDFIKNSSEWHYQYFNTGVAGCVKLLYESDVIKDGNRYKQYFKHYNTVNVITGVEFNGVILPEYLRSDGAKVYTWSDQLNKSILIYDFSAEVGDQWDIEFEDNPINSGGGNTIVCTVKEYGSDIVNSEFLQWQLVEYSLDGLYSFEEKIYNKFGPSRYALLPWDQFLLEVDRNEMGLLAKFTNGTFEFKTNSAPTCETSSIESQDNIGREINIYPNPVSDILTLKNIYEFESVKVYNQLGEQCDFNFTPSQIDVSSLESGLYFLKVERGNIIQSIRFIKN